MPGRDVGLLSPTTHPNHCRTLDLNLTGTSTLACSKAGSQISDSGGNHNMEFLVLGLLGPNEQTMGNNTQEAKSNTKHCQDFS